MKSENRHQDFVCPTKLTIPRHGAWIRSKLIVAWESINPKGACHSNIDTFFREHHGKKKKEKQKQPSNLIQCVKRDDSSSESLNVTLDALTTTYL